MLSHNVEKNNNGILHLPKIVHLTSIVQIVQETVEQISMPLAYVFNMSLQE